MHAGALRVKRALAQPLEVKQRATDIRKTEQAPSADAKASQRARSGASTSALQNSHMEWVQN
eukprot:6820300-Alexandrium_andersonii.AAC.1